MLAPSAGVCHKCHGAIAQGELVRSFNRPALGTWYHPACVGSKAAPSAPLTLTASVTSATVSNNGHAPSTGPTVAPSDSLDTLASALAPRDPTAPCPCSWLGLDYAERCAWLLAAVRAARRALDSWRSETLADLAATAATAATPDCARDLECYAEGVRHGLRLMGAIIEDANTTLSVAPREALRPSLGYGTLWAVSAGGAPEIVVPWTPDAMLPCTCTIVEAPDGASETLVTCPTCAARIAGGDAP